MFESDQYFINNVMSAPDETASTGGNVASKGVAPEVVSMEVPAAIPKVPRSPRPKPTLSREAPKPKMDKQKKTFPMRESLSKHAAT